MNNLFYGLLFAILFLTIVPVAGILLLKYIGWWIDKLI